MKRTLYLLLLVSFTSFSQTAEEYSKRGIVKDSLKDYYGAIADYTKAIEVNPSYAGGYFNRGNAKYKLGDIKGACQDATKAQKLGYDATEFINSVCN
jgi:tetratricopeptide (TPR) repeat protein